MLIASRAEARSNTKYYGKYKGKLTSTEGTKTVTIEIGSSAKKAHGKGFYIYIPRKGDYYVHRSTDEDGDPESFAWVRVSKKYMVFTYAGSWSKKKGWQGLLYLRWYGYKKFSILKGVDQDDDLKGGKAVRIKGTFRKVKK